MEKYKIPVRSTIDALRDKISLVFDTTNTLCGVAFTDENNLCIYTPSGFLVYNNETEFLGDYAGHTINSGTFEDFSRLCKQSFVIP